jgi:hypothetical protein
VKIHRSTFALGALALVLGAGCSFSTSSKSSSDSISDSSKSISDSSTSSSPADEKKSDDAAALYREDVRNLTGAQLRDGGDVADFQRKLAAVARQHGVGDWEGARGTWLAIGEALRSADAAPAQRDALSHALAGDDRDKLDTIARGYDGTRA